MGKFLLCLLVGAHFLEDWHALGRRLDYFRALFIERSDQGVPRVGINVADVLHVGTLAEMEALAGLEVGATGPDHGDVEQVAR